jgi:hypothetical protein
LILNDGFDLENANGSFRSKTVRQFLDQERQSTEAALRTERQFNGDLWALSANLDKGQKREIA